MTPVQQVTRGASYSRSSSALLEEHAEHAAGHVRDITILRIIAVRSSSSEMTEGEKVFLARSKKKLRGSWEAASCSTLY
jgi:hypothetical protein